MSDETGNSRVYRGSVSPETTVRRLTTSIKGQIKGVFINGTSKLKVSNKRVVVLPERVKVTE